LNLVGDFGGAAMCLAFGVVCAAPEACASGCWSDQRGRSRLDAGAPRYTVYQTRDDGCVAIGSGEPLLPHQAALAGPARRRPAGAGRRACVAASQFAGRRHRRDQDGCSLTDASRHAQQISRGNFVDSRGALQPPPAPRFSRTPGAMQHPPPAARELADIVLRVCGFALETIARWRLDAVSA
jgi:alpha-methylacyl-CoA racemase